MIRRRLARRLADHALDVMPPERRAWAEAMRAELEHIEGDGAALSFAAGAALTSYRHGAGLRSNQLRLGRWGGASAAAGLGLLSLYGSLWLSQLPPQTDAPPLTGGLLLLLGLLYLVGAWGLAKGRLAVFFLPVAAAATLITSAALSWTEGGDPALSASFYAALLAGEPASPGSFYAALMLEQCAFVLSLGVWGLIVWRLQARRVAA